MTVLVPSFLPPPPSTHQPLPPIVKPTPEPQKHAEPAKTLSILSQVSPPLEESRLSIPEVRLPVASISDEMAAAMTVGLLGHVLFLKNQIPLPINQLYRLSSQPSKKTTPSNALVSQKAIKKRTDLIEAFDELSCHLQSTFSALSTALAHSKSPHQSNPVDGRLGRQDENVQPVDGQGTCRWVVQRANAYVAIVLGPTVGVPKARVILSLEGLDVKVWGTRKETPSVQHPGSADPHEDRVKAEDRSIVNEDIEADSDVEPLPSDSDDEDSDTDSSSESESEEPTYAAQQAFLDAQTRLLSRRLAEANASEEGGLASEMGLTQTHVLIRAPRRFTHPSWRPLQSHTSSLDNTLRDFLDHSQLSVSPTTASTSANTTTTTTSGPDGDSPTKAGADDPTHSVVGGSFGLAMKPKKTWKGGVKTEGVWIGCDGVRRTRHSIDDGCRAALSVEGEALVGEAQGCAVDEEDEMIWWAWDGKLVGFAEW